jgi:hippurate hydrolase
MWLCLISALQAAEQPRQWAEANLDDLVIQYTELHSNPELTFQEKNTSARLATALSDCGYEVTTDVGGHGIVGLLENGDGPVVMLRADMDALPVTEQTGLPYASRVIVKNEDGLDTGVMHACGHDVHMTNLIGTACYLAANSVSWQGTLMLVGQPAEEKGAGARAMLNAGLFEHFPKPDYALALHVSPELATGRIAFRPGYTMANVDSVDITLHGKGGHGAYPHKSNDPVVQAAQLVLELQTIVSREIDPLEPAVITVGSLHSGTKNNIIGDSAELKLTVRSFSDEVRAHLLTAIERKANAVAISNAAPPPGIEIAKGTPALFNDPELARQLRPAFAAAIGEENIGLAAMTMAGEDFSRYGRAGVPSLMYWLGVVEQQRLDDYAATGNPPPSLHSPRFYPDIRPSLVTGISTMSAAILELLSRETD